MMLTIPGDTGVILWSSLAIASLAVFLFLCVALRIPEVIASRSWKETPCVISNSQVARDGGKIHLKVVYRYEVEARTYVGTRYGVFDPTSTQWHEIAVLTDALRPGHGMTCYVDPENPARAILDPRIGAASFWALVPLAVSVLSCIELGLILLGD